MPDPQRPAQRANLDKIATQLGEVKLLPVARDDHLELRATARFAVRKFEEGDYIVHVGLREALLRLEHPSFESGEPYEESLNAQSFEESSHKETKTSASGEIEASLGWRLIAKFRGAGKANAARNVRQETKSLAHYKIIAAEAGDTWRIGSELGDPRHTSTGPQAVAACLEGAYLDRPLSAELGKGSHPSTKPRTEEHPSARLGGEEMIKSAPVILCRLRPKPEGPDKSNDQRIVGKLTGAPRSLFVGLERFGPAAPVTRAHDSDREKELRKALIDICLQREALDDLTTDRKLTGEFLLHRHETMAPKIGSLPGKRPTKPIKHGEDHAP
jgi:hypothetical protein